MNRQHPWLHVIGIIILNSVTFSEICNHCQNLLDDPRNIKKILFFFLMNMPFILPSKAKYAYFKATHDNGTFCFNR